MRQERERGAAAGCGARSEGSGRVARLFCRVVEHHAAAGEAEEQLGGCRARGDAEQGRAVRRGVGEAAEAQLVARRLRGGHVKAATGWRVCKGE